MDQSSCLLFYSLPIMSLVHTLSERSVLTISLPRASFSPSLLPQHPRRRNRHQMCSSPSSHLPAKHIQLSKRMHDMKGFLEPYSTGRSSCKDHFQCNHSDIAMKPHDASQAYCYVWRTVFQIVGKGSLTISNPIRSALSLRQLFSALHNICVHDSKFMDHNLLAIQS